MILSTVATKMKKVLPVEYCGAVIVAAGTAVRMGGIDKMMALLRDKPVIYHTVKAFQDSAVIREIVIVTRPDLIVPMTNLFGGFEKVRAIVAGGASRQESVRMGLNALSGKVKLAAIQDGARPLITGTVIDRTVRAAHTYGAAAPAVPVKDTIKVVRGGMVKETPDRTTLQAVQTPQVFDIDLLKGALKKAEQDGSALTDDCSAVEHMGMSVKIVEGDEHNIKVTTPVDLAVAELFMEEHR